MLYNKNKSWKTLTSGQFQTLITMLFAFLPFASIWISMAKSIWQKEQAKQKPSEAVVKNDLNKKNKKWRDLNQNQFRNLIRSYTAQWKEVAMSIWVREHTIKHKDPGPEIIIPEIPKKDKKGPKVVIPASDIECPYPKYDGVHESFNIDCKVNGNTYTHSKMRTSKIHLVANPSFELDLYYYIFINANYNQNTGIVIGKPIVSIFIYTIDGAGSSFYRNLDYDWSVNKYDVTVKKVSFTVWTGGDADSIEHGGDIPRGPGGTLDPASGLTLNGGAPNLEWSTVTSLNTFKFAPCNDYPSAPSYLTEMMYNNANTPYK